MRLRLATTIAAPPERVWAAIQTSAVVQWLARPQLRFTDQGPGPMPDQLPDHPHHVGMWWLGVVYLGRQTLRITRHVAPGEWRLHDDGTGRVARRWEHWATLRAAPNGTTWYEDDVTIEAGVMTSLVWAFAWGFFRARQRRLRRLAARDFALPH